MDAQHPDWEVFTVAHYTHNGLRFTGGTADLLGLDTEIAYLCHYPRSSVPLDETPARDTEAELALLIRWAEAMDQGLDRDTALQRACEAA